MYNLSTAYSKLPSDFFEFETEIGKWQFNEMCLLVGRKIENQLANKEKPFDEDAAGVQKYRSAASGRKIKRVKINPNGTW